jgi:hypothetical protein
MDHCAKQFMRFLHCHVAMNESFQIAFFPHLLSKSSNIINTHRLQGLQSVGVGPMGGICLDESVNLLRCVTVWLRHIEALQGSFIFIFRELETFESARQKFGRNLFNENFHSMIVSSKPKTNTKCFFINTKL